MTANKILIVGGYGEVGRRLVDLLEEAQPGRVVVAGRHPERARGARARQIDLDTPVSIERALDDVAVVVACVRQRQPHLLRAALLPGSSPAARMTRDPVRPASARSGSVSGTRDGRDDRADAIGR